MKRLKHLYQKNSVIWLIANSIAFLAWAISVIVIITILTVAFTG